jgi:hypothetical protein
MSKSTQGVRQGNQLGGEPPTSAVPIPVSKQKMEKLAVTVLKAPYFKRIRLS